jgi:hypothetical protein
VICQACGFPSRTRVCRGCRKYYGTADDAIAGSALARRFQGKTFPEVFAILSELVDVFVEWPSVPHNHHTKGRTT